jgi:hypothetical protein
MKDNKTSRLKAAAQALLARYAATAQGLFGQVLSAQDVASAVQRHVPSYRSRIFSPVDTLRLFVGQMLSADDACQDVVAKRLSERVAQGHSPNALSTSAYCQARQRLPVELPEELGRILGNRVQEQAQTQWSWRGRRLVLFDATVLSMPDTASNQQAYPQNGREKVALGFPKARVGALIDMASGAVLGHGICACKGKGTGEQGLLNALVPLLGSHDVLLADALLADWWSIANVQARGCHVVMRQNGRRATDFRRGKRLGKADHVVQWPRPAKPAWMTRQQYECYPLFLVMREASINARVLVTTLLEPGEASKDELDTLYSARWHIEVDFRTIKCVMQMDILKCKTSQMVDKEIAVGLLAYNLVRLAMAQAAVLGNVLPRALSFKGAKRILNAFEEALRHGTKSCITAVLQAIASLKLPWRPDRIEPRAKKRRPKNLPKLTMPRHMARAVIKRRRGLT